MSIRSKQFYAIVLAQVFCIAVGLWMQHHQLKATIEAAAVDEARLELGASASELRKELQDRLSAEFNARIDEIKTLQVILNKTETRRFDVTVVDREWRSLARADGGKRNYDWKAQAGESLEWTPASERTPDLTESTHGTLATANGPQIAVTFPLSDGRGRVLLHRPVADIDARTLFLAAGLPVVGGVAFLWFCALLSITTYLILAHFHDMLDRQRTRTSSDILRQTQTLVRTRDAVIFALGKLADSRDRETRDHVERISTYSTLLASNLSNHPKFAQQVTPAFVRLIGISSVLHDIGKVGIEDRILRKPGPLTPDERKEMQRHTIIAGDCLGEIAQRLGSSNFLEMAREIALAHHEHWDGSGYPAGRKGEQIPLSARIVAIVDTYDALSSRRVYKDAMPHEQCVSIIRAAAGRQFDPDLTEAWLKMESQFRTIAARRVVSASETPGGDAIPAFFATEELGSTGESDFSLDPMDELMNAPDNAARPAAELGRRAAH